MNIGPWEPDSAVVNGQSMVLCRNVYAAAGKGYIPVKGMSQIAGALDEQYMGAAAFLAADGTPRLLAGSTTDLYSLTAGAWVSLITSLTVDKPWRFVQFGDDAVGVYGGAPVEIALTANTASTLSGSPPDADLISVVRDFVVLGRCDGDETMVTWSAFNDHTGWTPGTNQSGFQPMLTGGKITGLTGGEYGLILQRDRIARMSYTGDPDQPFQFDEISTNFGCIAEGSVVQAGGLTFCYSRRGFIKIEAGGITPIGVERVDRTFREAYSEADLVQMSATADPERTVVMFHLFGRVWCYNWVLDRWTDIVIASQAIFSALTASITIDELDAIYGDLDAITESLDSPIFSGGNPRVFIVKNDGTFQALTGSNLGATFKFSPQEPFAGARTRFSKARPVTDAVSGITLTMDYAQRLGNSVETRIYTTLRDSGDMPIHLTGRYITATLDIAADTTWTFASALEFPKMSPAGDR